MPDSIRDLVHAYALSRDPQFFAPEATIEQMPVGRVVRGRTAIGAMFRSFYLEAFSNGDEHIRGIAVDDTRRVGVVESIFRGRHAREALGIPLSGSRIEVPIIGIYEFEADQIARGRVYFDVATLLGRFRADTVPASEEGERGRG
jgi:limonene-1,2-epoxide hydrolase